MEFSVDRGEFLEALGITQGVVERRNAMPILANVLLSVSNKGLTIAASDLDIHVKRRLKAKAKTNGAATVGARKLFEFIRELKAGEVTLKALENHFVEVVSGRSRLKLVGLPADDFPAFPQAESEVAESFEIPEGKLGWMIDCTIFALSTDDTRPHLGGVLLLRSEGTVRFVGTDGHRLGLIEYPVAGGPKEPRSAIMPRKGLAEVRKLLGAGEQAVRLSIGSSIARVNLAESELAMRLVEGEFPNYEQVLPKSSKHRFPVSTAELLSALRRVSVVASDRARGVRIQLTPGLLQVAATSPDFGEASEEIEIPYTAAELAVGFNARYLMEVLAVLGDVQKVEIGLSDDASPCEVRAEDDDAYRYVVMPMRL